MVFQCINIRQVPLEVLKTKAKSLGFQHLPRYLANVNAWKTMFDPYSNGCKNWIMKNYIRAFATKHINSSLRINALW